MSDIYDTNIIGNNYQMLILGVQIPIVGKSIFLIFHLVNLCMEIGSSAAVFEELVGCEGR